MNQLASIKLISEKKKKYKLIFNRLCFLKAEQTDSRKKLLMNHIWKFHMFLKLKIVILNSPIQILKTQIPKMVLISVKFNMDITKKTQIQTLFQTCMILEINKVKTKIAESSQILMIRHLCSHCISKWNSANKAV